MSRKKVLYSSGDVIGSDNKISLIIIEVGFDNLYFYSDVDQSGKCYESAPWIQDSYMQLLTSIFRGEL